MPVIELGKNPLPSGERAGRGDFCPPAAAADPVLSEAEGTPPIPSFT